MLNYKYSGFPLVWSSMFTVHCTDLHECLNASVIFQTFVKFFFDESSGKWHLSLALDSVLVAHGIEPPPPVNIREIYCSKDTDLLNLQRGPWFYCNVPLWPADGATGNRYCKPAISPFQRFISNMLSYYKKKKKSNSNWI